MTQFLYSSKKTDDGVLEKINDSFSIPNPTPEEVEKTFDTWKGSQDRLPSEEQRPTTQPVNKKTNTK